MADPKFVQLHKKMSGSTIADVTGGSGWRIAGTQVRPFPKGDKAARFVRSKLVAGQLVEASSSDYDEFDERNAKEFDENDDGETEDQGDDVAEDDEPAADYGKGWTNATRAAELEARGLDSSGNKDELIARLLASDDA